MQQSSFPPPQITIYYVKAINGWLQVLSVMGPVRHLDIVI